MTLSTIFFELLVLHNLFSKAEMRQFHVAGTEGLTFRPYQTLKSVQILPRANCASKFSRVGLKFLKILENYPQWILIG